MACVGCTAIRKGVKSVINSVVSGNVVEAAEKAVVVVKYTSSRSRGGRRTARIDTLRAAC